jgi:phospholipid/cholesterol/gamma-HCH transport system permease protein
MFFTLDNTGETLHCEGEWTLANLAELKEELFSFTSPERLKTIDGSNITKMDSAGAMGLRQFIHTIKDKTIALENFKKEQLSLFDLINDAEQLEKLPPRFELNPLAKLGKAAVDKASELWRFLNFIGELTFDVIRLFAHTSRYPWRSLISEIESTGVQALPIVALLSFLVGVVLAYQMMLQLKDYGADIYVVNFLGLSIMREFSPLITAIIIAGRTGSAFTAQLGTMKIREEIDALRTMGIAPAELLIIPKIMALMITVPLLTVWSIVFGVFGGMVMAKSMSHIGFSDFLHRFYEVIQASSYYTGMYKTPVFGFCIAAIGCYQGSQVSGSATSVGQKTTISVVQSIFFIIVIDAIFSIIYAWLDI